MKRLLVITLFLLGFGSCGYQKETVVEAIDNLSTVITQQDTSSVVPLTFVEDSISTYTGTLAEILIDKYSYEIKNDIIVLAKEVKKPAMHIYNVFVKQQVIKSLTWCFVYLLLIAAAFAFYIAANKSEDEDYKEAFGVLSIIITVVLIIVIFASIFTVSRGFFNPEYGAIKEIINILTGKLF